MTRWLTLILFSFGVLHAAGISLPREAGHDCATLCGSHEPVQAKPVSSCCPLSDAMAQAPAHDYCPVSNGPCTCGITPDDAPAPAEPMPIPSRDRDSLPMTRATPASIQLITAELPTRLLSIARTGSIRAGFSHNQTQALLGIWQR
jgi:hypothetical protein